MLIKIVKDVESRGCRVEAMVVVVKAGASDVFSSTVCDLLKRKQTFRLKILDLCAYVYAPLD